MHGVVQKTRGNLYLERWTNKMGNQESSVAWKWQQHTKGTKRKEKGGKHINTKIQETQKSLEENEPPKFKDLVQV